MPIIKRSSEQQGSSQQSTKTQIQEVQKPATLDFNDKRKKSQNFKEIVQTTPSTSNLTASPKLPRHQKIRDLGGSRTPSPSSVSRKSSFASLFKVKYPLTQQFIAFYLYKLYIITLVIKQGSKTDASALSPESPSASAKPRRSLTAKLRDTTESLRSRSKSRERVTGDKSSTPKKESKNKGVFSSTLSLFKKRERKKSYDEAMAVSCISDRDARSSGEQPSLESIGHVEFTFNIEKDRCQEDSIFISLHGTERHYEEALPSESVSIPLETPTKLLDEYESEPCSSSIITEASIEHRPGTVAKIRTEAQIETTAASRVLSRDNQLPKSTSRDSQISKSSSRDSKIGMQADRVVETPSRSSTSKEVKSISSKSSRDSTGKRPDIVKPKRKVKETQQQIEAFEKVDLDVSQKKEVSSTELPQSTEMKRSDLLDDKDKGDRVAQRGLVKTPSVMSDLDHNSSGSERDSEVEFIRSRVEKLAEELPDERKGLFYEESFEEDLPYVPTTLPLEKSVAVPILPVKQRLQEIR